MVGPEFALVTVIENAPKALDCVPLLTLIAMFGYVPVWPLAGVPESRPLAALNVAHAGRFWIENVRGVPFGALVVGWNE
jgi:hypothetical protein